MKIPGFMAEAALYGDTGLYRKGITLEAVTGIRPAQFGGIGGGLPGASLVCDVCETICQTICESKPNPDRCFSRCRQRRCPQC